MFEIPPFIILFTHSAAVIPAVPWHIALKRDKFSGNLTTHSDGKWTISPNPPNSAIPILYPVAITSSPGIKSLEEDFITSPATSTPGTNGYDLTTPFAPVAARASL